MHRFFRLEKANTPDASLDAGKSRRNAKDKQTGHLQQELGAGLHRPNIPPPTLIPRPLRCVRGALAPGGPGGMAGEPDASPQRCVGGSCNWGSACGAPGLDSIP